MKNNKDVKMYDLRVIDNPIYGDAKNLKNKLWAIFWQRMANSGIILCWAENEAEAINRYGFNPKIVKCTVTQLTPGYMPVQYGKEE